MIVAIPIIPSVTGLVTAVGALVAAVGGMFVSVALLRTTKSTHNIVNQQRTDMLRYQDVLTHCLADAGLRVPDDTSIEHPAAS